MNNTEEKIIMYDSPEAGRLVTVTAWEVDNPNGKIYTLSEANARYNNCTHKTCECGKPMGKYYTRCESCRAAAAVERYNSLPFKEWNFDTALVTWDGDRYFFNEEGLIEYLEENEMDSIDLLFCTENHFNTIDNDYWADVLAEDSEGELPKEMQEALYKLNEIISKQTACSYSPGKIRTTYKK